MSSIYLAPIFWIGLLPFFASASTVPPAIVGFKGSAKVLVKKGESLPSLLFEGEKFFYLQAKVGMKIDVGSIIICATDCRIKLVYPSGTSVFIAPGTTFQVIAAENTGKGERSVLKLLYGRIRSMVSKSGTQNWEVRTPSAVNGVRGTDFLTRHISGQGTEVAVLSGKVEVAPVEAAQPKIQLAPRQSTTENAQGQFKIDTVTKAQVISAYEATVVPTNTSESTEVKQLEEKSRLNLLEELKSSQPTTFKALANTDTISQDELNKKLIEEPLRKAKATTGGSNMPESFNQDLDQYKKLDEGR